MFAYKIMAAAYVFWQFFPSAGMNDKDSLFPFPGFFRNVQVILSRNEYSFDLVILYSGFPGPN